MFVEKVKNKMRQSRHLEVISYLIHNNLFAKTLNFSGEGSFDKSVEGLYAHGVKIGDQYLENTPCSVRGRRLLEIGSGLSLTTAFHLVTQGGAGHVYAYDWFACRHGNDKALIERYGFGAYVDRVTYVTGDYSVLAKSIPEGSIDLVISNAVLEHVADLSQLFEVLMQVLKLSGAMYHRVDLRCHNRFRRQGELYFHTFGERLWQAMGNRVGHPSRRLLKDYMELFKRNGLMSEFKNVKTFSVEILNEAESYLNGKNLKDYEMAVFDVVLTRREVPVIG